MRRLGTKLLCAVAAALVLASAAPRAAAAAGGTLDGIKQTKTLRIAFRADAPPFSYKGNLGAPSGYMVDLCKAVAAHLDKQLGMQLIGRLRARYVGQPLRCDRSSTKPIFSANRRARRWSGARSSTSRFPTFIDGASLMIRADDTSGTKDLASLAGKKVGVLAGTTTEQELRNSLKAASIAATVVPVTTHSQGLAMLQNSQIAGYFRGPLDSRWAD